MSFVHLHLHTEYSLLDGANRIHELVEQVKRLGMPAVAMTDHGVMYGTMEFYKACRREGIKPIIGCEVYLAPGSRFDRDQQDGLRYYHLVLLAEDNQGYQNLIRLASLASLEGFYYRPRIDYELLERYHEGLIALSACLAGEVPTWILRGDMQRAERAALRMREIFGPDHFFLELQNHNLPEQAIVNAGLIEIARRHQIPLVATNDAHYLRREDAEAQEVLLCIQTGRTLEDGDRLQFANSEFYVKSPEEMAAVFADYPEALRNTLRIAERCQVDFQFGQLQLPRFDLPAGYDEARYLRELCYKRLPERYEHPGPQVLERLNYELDMIEKMGFPGYFLIVQDFVRYAKSMGISVGPGRGSAAGSLTAYVLGITNIDPLRYNLLFERFLNPERITMPDIDIDFDDRRRGEVIDYVIGKYGKDAVAQIITFGRMMARAVIRDVGRVLGMSYAEVDRIAKLVPAGPGVTLAKAKELVPELAAMAEDERSGRLLRLAERLEGLPRHASVHAAGVVIAPRPLIEMVPLQQMNEGNVVTQYPMGVLEELGLLKMDFLGLRTLTVIKECTRLVEDLRGEKVDPDALPMDDQATYQLLSRAETDGVFQLESSGMKDMLRELQPSNLEDIVAAVSLFRPGPMENIPQFIQNKHSGNYGYLHPDLEPILKDTYGILVYQEQIMQVASTLAGFSLGQADILRRAMGKKKLDELASQKLAFIEGCVRRGYSQHLAQQVFDLILKFANYGFNRSHAAAYAYMAYQTAYLKAHYPKEFMAALLTSLLGDADKTSYYVQVCRSMKIPILPPDINTSQVEFSVEEDGIRFALSAVKNVGRATVEAIVEEREAHGPYKSLYDLCVRVEEGGLNRRCLESLIKAGAFDRLGERGSLMAGLDLILSAAHEAQKRKNSGQMSLFDLNMGNSSQTASPEPELPVTKPLSTQVRLAQEKEVLGFYLSGHPLEHYRQVMEQHARPYIGKLDEIGEQQAVSLVGMVVARRQVSTRKGEIMAFVQVEDLTGQVEVVCYPNTWREARAFLEKDAVVRILGRVSRRDEEISVVAERIEPVKNPDVQSRTLEEDAGMYGPEPLAVGTPFRLLQLHIEAPHPPVQNSGFWLQLQAILAGHPGPCPVVVHWPDGRQQQLARGFGVEPSRQLEEELAGLIGSGHGFRFENIVS